MYRPSFLVLFALCLSTVYCKPAVPEIDQSAAISRIGDPKFMAAFLEFLQNHLAGDASTAAPPIVEPEVTVPIPKPSVTIPTTPLNPPTVDSRAPFPGFVPQPEPTVTLPNKPVQVEPKPSVTIPTTPLNPPTVDSRAPFPGFVPQPEPTVTLPNNPVQVEPKPSVTIPTTPLNPPTVDSRAPFPGFVPQPEPTVTLPNNPVQVEPHYSQAGSSVQQWGNVRIVTHPRINIDTPELLTPEQLKKQAMNAKYRFSTYEDDNIKGSFLTRAEVRDGEKINGMYGYDDGFINKMVYYVADEQGFRIVKEETKPSTKTGKLDGTARIQNIQDNIQVDYNIASKDINTSTKILV